MPKRDRSQLLREIKAAFLEITSQLNTEQRLLHFEVDVFRRFTQRAIFDGERDIAVQCFALAATYLTEGNSSVRNAMDVSFIEPMEFGSPANERRWAWEAMPEVLRSAYVGFHRKSAV